MITPRQYVGGFGGPYYYDGDSNWDRWGRWVLAGILIFIGVVALLGIAFWQARRRRRAHPINAVSNYNSSSTPMTNTGNYYNNSPYPQTEQGYGQGQEYGQTTYSAPPGPPPQYNAGSGYESVYGHGQGVTQPGSTYQPRK